MPYLFFINRMNMQNFEDLDIDALVARYEQMLSIGRKIYFDADEFAALGDYYISIGEYESAEEIVDEGMIMHPGNSLLAMLKAKVLVAFDFYEEALAYLDTVSDEGDVDIVLVRVEALFNTMREDEAFKLIAETLERKFSEDDLYQFLTEVGFILADLAYYDRAVYFFERSAKMDDTNIDVLTELAFGYEWDADVESAIKITNRILDLDPYSYDAWVNMGRLYSMDSQYEEAISAFDFAHTIKEDEVDALKMKALSLFLNDNADEAIKTFKECIKRSPDDVSIYDSIIEGYESLEQYEDMIKYIDLKEERFGSAGIVIKRTFVEILRDDIVKAWEYYNQVPEAERETLEFFMLEGELNFVSEKLKESEASYIKAALISEDNEEIIDRLANVSVAQEKFKQAESYLEQLLLLDPFYPTAKARLAFIRFEIGVKEPFDEIMRRFNNDELRELLQVISDNDGEDLSDLSREKMLIRLNEARENRILFKNIKY